MRVLRTALWGLGAALALLFLLSGMVEGPAPERAEALPAPETALRITAETPLSPGPAVDRTAEPEPQRALPAEPCFARLPRLLSSDRNGCPLGSRPWHCAAWAVCPPEAVFG